MIVNASYTSFLLIILYSSVLLHQLCQGTENRSHHLAGHRVTNHPFFIGLKYCQTVFRPELEGKKFDFYFDKLGIASVDFLNSASKPAALIVGANKGATTGNSSKFLLKSEYAILFIYDQLIG